MSGCAIGQLALALGVLAGQADGLALEPSNDPRPETPIRSVLDQEDYPWYDSQRDDVRPLLPDPSSWAHRLGKQVEELLEWIDRQFRRQPSEPGKGATTRSILPALLFLVTGVVFLNALWRLWRLHEPGATSGDERQASVGEVARMAGLSAGSSLEGLDPWAEANLRRAAGDLPGAVIWLFLDQLLSLHRARQIRLAPGKTARQYTMALDDRPLREGLCATLAVFEEVYYGGRSLAPATVDQLWSRAETFRARLAMLGRAS